MTNARKESLKSVTVRIPTKQHTALKMYAVKKRTTIQEIVENYITDILSKKETVAS